MISQYVLISYTCFSILSVSFITSDELNVSIGGSGPSFEEEPSDSFIVRSKSAILRCKTLNALNAWFKCNTGDERAIQSKQNGHNYVDPQTGIRIIELQLDITRADIEEHAKAGYTTPYQCWCSAYGGHQEIISRKASILFSYLRKHFINEPLSQSVPVHSQTSLTCLPPEGDPKPALFWLKNGEIINVNNRGTAQLSDHSASDIIPRKILPDHSNYLIGHDGSLIIKQTTLLDQANYTCAVKNPVGVRYSESATLTVYVNGGWSSWSSWSECNVKCGRGTQRRIRYCSNPTPVNNGQPCPGESTQISDCSVICSPINGHWTSWSSWSTCSHECSQVRRRICSNPSPKYGGQHCMGHDFLIKNCTGGMCRKLDLYQLQRREKEENGTNDAKQQIYFMSIIITSVFLFIILLFIFIMVKRRRYKNQGWNDDDEERSGEDGHAMLLLLQQQHHQPPDLIRNGTVEKYQMISRVNNGNSNLLDHFVVRCDPLPSVPNTANTSIDSGIASHNNNHAPSNHLTPSISGTPKLMPASALSMATTTATLTTSEENINDPEPDYAEPIIISNGLSQTLQQLPIASSPLCMRMPQRVLPPPPPIPSTPPPEGRSKHNLNNIRNLRITRDMMTTGCFSFSPKLGVAIYIPPNAVDLQPTGVLEQQNSFFYGIDLESKYTGVNSLSPICIFGINGNVEFNRPIVLIMQHCLCLNHGIVPNGLSILWQENMNQLQFKSSPKWIEILRYGEEDMNTSCNIDVDDRFVYLSTNLTGKFMFCVRKNLKDVQFKSGAIIKEDSVSPDINDTPASPFTSKLYLEKSVNFSLSVEQFSSTEQLLRAYIYDNLASSVINFSNETSNNRRTKLGDTGTVLRLSSNAGPICLEVIHPKEKGVKGMRHVQVPLNHLCNSGPNSLLHCSFIILNNPSPTIGYPKSNFQIKVWQNKGNEKEPRNGYRNVILNFKNDHNDFNIFDQMKDKIVKLYGDSDINVRLSLTAHLDLPRTDQKDWREFAMVSKIHHYLPYFASQQSPTTHLMDLWEAKLIINDLSQLDNNDNADRQRIYNETLKQNIIEVLSDMQRNDLISILYREE